MTIVKKTLLITGTALLASIFALYLIASALFMKSYTELEQHKMKMNLDRVAAELEYEIESLRFITRDWAEWDDMYQYVLSQDEVFNTDFESSNMNLESFKRININLILIFNVSGNLVFGIGNDAGHERVFFPSSRLVQLFQKNKDLLLNPGGEREGVSGILMLREGALLISALSILPSDESEKQPSRGTLVMGRLFVDDEISGLSQRMHFKIQVQRYSDKLFSQDFELARMNLKDEKEFFIRPVDSETIAGYMMIKDSFGNPALILKLEMPRDIYAQGKKSLNFLIVSAVLIGIVFISLIWILLVKLILSRLTQLNSQLIRIRKNKDVSIRVPLTGRDEIASVAAAVNGMLDEIESFYGELRKTEETARQSVKMEAIGRLAGGIAHDFNNLLTAIIGYSDLIIKSKPEDPSIRKEVEEIRSAGERAAELTRQLLAFGRKQVFEVKVVDLNVIVSDAGKMLSRVISENIELVTLLESKLRKIKADPAQVEQIIFNLAVNARDAMPNGGKLIIETANIKLDEQYQNKKSDIKAGEYVMLAVSDTGQGMDPETISHLFEPFFTTKENSTGSGLGLCSVYGIVKQSGGNIYVYSELGLGTTFKIYFPQCKENGTRETLHEEEVIPVAGQKTILLVEDEDMVRRLASEVLKRQGYEVLEAANGPEALLIAEDFRNTVHLLLTDVVMPKMSGTVLAEKIKAMRPDILILFMSGYADTRVISESENGNGQYFLQKPFTPEKLLRKLNEIFSQSRELK